LSFREVKAHAIFFLLELEKQGKVTRSDGYQDILNAIAHDVRSKHRTRLQRQQEIENMTEALRHLKERKKYFEEQINSYNSYVEVSMATMQRGKSYATTLHSPVYFVLTRSQEKANHHAFYEAIFPPQRPSKIRQDASIRLIQVQRTRPIREGHTLIDRPIFPETI
jgi:RasGAP C-terminus